MEQAADRVPPSRTGGPRLAPGFTHPEGIAVVLARLIAAVQKFRARGARGGTPQPAVSAAGDLHGLVAVA